MYGSKVYHITLQIMYMYARKQGNCSVEAAIVTAQQQPQPQQQNNHNCSYSWDKVITGNTTTTTTTNSKLYDRAEIEQNSENKSY